MSTSYQSSGFTGLNGGSLPFRIGASLGDSANNIYGYTGKMDNLSLWKGTLSQLEVTTAYQTTIPEPVSIIPVMIGIMLLCWKKTHYLKFCGRS